MKEWIFPTSRQGLALLAGLTLAASPLLVGCGTDSYDEPGAYAPTVTRTSTALIEPADVKAWMDQGLVNKAADGTERVVILTVGSKGEYEVSHLPGALLWDSGNSAGEPSFHQTRVEGLSTISTMVPDGASMDSLYRSRGIDGCTTVVISHSGGNMMNPARAYFTLRYWGFPKAQIKVLNGGNAAWNKAVIDNGWDALRYGATGDVVKVPASTYSVRDGEGLNAGLRLSLGEMLQEVDRNLDSLATTGYILDARGGTDFAAAAIPAQYPTYSFQGSIANAIRDDHAAYYSGTGFKALGTPADAVDGPIDTLWEQLKFHGVSNDKPIITYCVSGMRAAVPFFVIDGILGWDVTLYDGSWNQWGSYAEHYTTPPTIDAAKTPKDAWRTDKFGRSTINSAPGTDRSTTVRNSTLTWDAARINNYITNTDGRANQIENEDALYMVPIPSAAGDRGASAGGSASGC